MNLSSKGSIIISPLYFSKASLIFLRPIPCKNLSFLSVKKSPFNFFILFVLEFSILIT